MTDDLEGKVILLTGGTEGVGKAAARVFAQRRATLVLVARNREKGERVVLELKTESANPHITSILGDLSKLADIRRVAAAFRDKHKRLDVLANNAGALFAKHTLSADGIEMTFALNHLSYFLLTHELRPVLEATPAARVISTASHAHRRGKIDLETIANRPDKKGGFQVYSDSKLANVLFTRELARRLQGTSVTANCFHPGFVHSAFGTNNPGVYGKVVTLLSSTLGRSPERGAETLTFLATSPAALGSSGEYFFNSAIARTTATARDPDLAKRLWQLSERLCGIA